MPHWTKSHENTNIKGRKREVANGLFNTRWAAGWSPPKQLWILCFVCTPISIPKTMISHESLDHGTMCRMELPKIFTSSIIKSSLDAAGCARLCLLPRRVLNSSEWEILPSLGGPSYQQLSKTKFFGIKSDFPTFQLVLNASSPTFLLVSVNSS